MSGHVSTSHKLALLEHLLPVLYSRGRRVLLFSTSTSTLDILQDYLNYRGYSYERLDGSVRGDERFQSIERFQGQHTKVATKDSHDEKELSSTLRNRKVANDGESTIPFVFLLSTRAGGQGITLTKANTVIFYDSDPNPMMDLQVRTPPIYTSVHSLMRIDIGNITLYETLPLAVHYSYYHGKCFIYACIWYPPQPTHPSPLTYLSCWQSGTQLVSTFPFSFPFSSWLVTVLLFTISYFFTTPIYVPI